MKRIVWFAAISIAIISARGEEKATAEERHAKAELKLCDTNSDGKISPDEFRSKKPQNAAEVFKKGDTDSDGFLSPEEFKAVTDQLQKEKAEKIAAKKAKGEGKKPNTPRKVKKLNPE